MFELFLFSYKTNETGIKIRNRVYYMFCLLGLHTAAKDDGINGGKL
jgi:hypothetical protein